VPGYDVWYLDPRGQMCLECDAFYSQSWLRALLPIAFAAGSYAFFGFTYGNPGVGILSAMATYGLAAYLSACPQPMPVGRDALIPAEQIRPLVTWLAQRSERDAFVTLIVPGSGPGRLDDVTVQFSVEDGQLGLDWLSTTKRNRTDRPKVRKWAETAGFSVNSGRQNGVSYLRIEGASDSAQLCLDLLRELYGVNAAHPVEVLSDVSLTVLERSNVTLQQTGLHDRREAAGK
jgi:hypothetical protein